MPTNTQSHRSPRTVGDVPEPSRGSKEFHETDDGMTVEVVHAEKILREHFEKLGYDEWVFGSICSRKLLEKVQNRQTEPVRGPGFVRGEDLRVTPDGQWHEVPQPIRRPGTTPLTLEELDAQLQRPGNRPIIPQDMPIWVARQILEADGTMPMPENAHPNPAYEQATHGIEFPQPIPIHVGPPPANRHLDSAETLGQQIEQYLIERRIRQESIGEGLTQRQDQPDETPF